MMAILHEIHDGGGAIEQLSSLAVNGDIMRKKGTSALRSPFLMQQLGFLEYDQRAVLAYVSTGESIAWTGDRAASLFDAVHEAVDGGFEFGAGDHHVDLASFGFTCIIAAGACRKHIEFLLDVGEYAPATSR